ncbi:probable thiopurine S-methyltransferase [Ptychodera flava]|uniref:probable thiopurine S-methyltransferase n=1 Tax=Ptychodera flava TaxID=63121 RepID=UPI00396A2162
MECNPKPQICARQYNSNAENTDKSLLPRPMLSEGEILSAASMGQTVSCSALLAEQGHDVIGLEFSELATKSFFEEQHLNYTVSPVETIQGASVFKADDCQIQIYCCDFFAFTSAIAGQFDAVWDRHAFGAMLPKRRTQYSQNLMSLMKPDGNCLMMTAQYDATVMQGPPFNVRTELIQEFFGDRCDIRKIEQGDAMRDKWRAKGHKWFEWVLHHLSCKQ